MDALSIIAKNLKNFICKNTVIFIIMLLSLTVSTVTVLYVLVKVDTFSDRISNKDLNLKDIYLYSKEQVSVDDVYDRLQKYYKDNNSVDYISANVQMRGLLTCFITDEEKNLNKYANDQKPLKGRFLTDEEIKNGDNVFIGIGLGYDDPEKYSEELNGIKLKCVGIYSRNGLTNGYAPLNMIRKNDIMPLDYKITYDHDLSATEVDEKKSELEELFPEFNAENQADCYDEKGIRTLSIENMCLILAAVTAVIACAYIYSYMLSARLKEIYIFKICGASKGKLVRLFMGEITAMLIIQFLLSAVVFKLGIIKFIEKYDYAFSYGFSVKHIFISFGVFTVLSFIIFIPALLHYCGKSAMDIKQRQKG